LLKRKEIFFDKRPVNVRNWGEKERKKGKFDAQREHG